MLRHDAPSTTIARDPSRTADALLRLFATTLIACSLLSALTFLYAVLSNSLAEHRRHLNDGAYKAQLFLDQRESLLRAIAATSVPDEEITVREPGGSGPHLSPIPLPGVDANGSSWQLAITPRMLRGIELAHARLVHTAISPLQAHVLIDPSGDSPHWEKLPASGIPAGLQFMPLPGAHHRPIMWLHQPGSNEGRLAVYAPVDRRDIQSGWISLELSDLRHALLLPLLPESAYTLLDGRGGIVLQSSNAPRNLAGLNDDFFGFRYEGWFPHDIVLSRAIGTGGLRIAYSIPTSQLLAEARGTIALTVAVEAAFAGLTLLGLHTARRRFIVPAAEQHAALLDSVELNRSLIATAPVGLAVVSHDTSTILLGNRLARSWMQHDHSWRDRMATEDQIVHSGADLDDGRHLQVTAVPLPYRGQRVSLLVATDMTAQKQTEASLITARRVAESASHAKARSLAIMSHEIRTPLYGITGTLDLLSSATTPAQHAYYIDLLHRSSAALVRTVNDSLDLSKIESGHMELESSDFCLLNLIDELISAFAARAESKGLHLYSLADIPSSGSVLGDPRRIRQILGNLVSNAIKFTETGSVVLRVRAFKHLGDRMQIIFQVNDTGAGIEAESIDRLFEPYFRAGSALTRNVPGTGLGLAISNHLAQLMGGSLQVVSRPGQGSSISLQVSLPLGSGSPDGPAPPRLKRTPVFVSGAIPEMVTNLCRWLNRWGAVAQPWHANVHDSGNESVLLQAWPTAPEHPLWRGPKVMARPAGSGVHGVLGDHVITAPAHALLGIGWAVQEAQSNRRPKPAVRRTSATPVPFGLDAMVVDDNPINQLIMKTHLEAIGCRVILADDGPQALQLASQASFDVIITDLNMPEMSGYALAQALRETGYRGQILGTSVDASSVAGEEWKAAGMDALLIKPIFLSTLREQMSSAILLET